MARWILSTDLVIEFLRRGEGLIGPIKLPDLAVSALTFNYILAEVEYSALQPAERSRFRTSVLRFRDMLRASGGEIPTLNGEALEQWGRVHLLKLQHRNLEIGETFEMPTEERLVVATAVASGYVYITQKRDWNPVLEKALNLQLKII